MSNVIDFPLDKRKENILFEKLEKALQEDSDDFDITLEHTDEALSILISELIDLGYAVNDEKYICEVSFLWESIKACLMRVKDMDHPLHDVAHKLYINYIVDEDAPQQLELDL